MGDAVGAVRHAQMLQAVVDAFEARIDGRHKYEGFSGPGRWMVDEQYQCGLGGQKRCCPDMQMCLRVHIAGQRQRQTPGSAEGLVI